MYPCDQRKLERMRCVSIPTKDGFSKISALSIDFEHCRLHSSSERLPFSSRSPFPLKQNSWVCHGNFGPGEFLVRRTIFSGKFGPAGPFFLRNFGPGFINVCFEGDSSLNLKLKNSSDHRCPPKKT